MERTDWLLMQKIYHTPSMSKVAEQMFITQPAVAYRLKKIEDEYQQQLFIRDNHGVRLTDAGLRLYSYAERVLNLDEEIANTVRNVRSDYSGRITLGATQSFTSFYLCDQLKAFSEAYPNIEFSIELFPSNNLYELYRAKKLPVVILRGNGYENLDGEHATLIEEPLLVIASEQITMHYLRTHPFIINNFTHNMSIDSMMADWLQHNFDTPPKVSNVQISGDSRIMVEMVKKGFGWSIITRTRLRETDCLYSMPIYRANDRPYIFKTQLYYRAELKQQEPYGVYLRHLINYFDMNQSRI